MQGAEMNKTGLLIFDKSVAIFEILCKPFFFRMVKFPFDRNSEQPHNFNKPKIIPEKIEKLLSTFAWKTCKMLLQ